MTLNNWTLESKNQALGGEGWGSKMTKKKSDIIYGPSQMSVLSLIKPVSKNDHDNKEMFSQYWVNFSMM